jgi:ATP-dependent Clp protease adaptor protein ClpS
MYGGVYPPYKIGDIMASAVDTVKQEKVVVSLQPPKLWKVVFLNDDKTPMELVIVILMEVFKHDAASAQAITMEVHNTGSAVAGVYVFEIAEQRGIEATNIARTNGAPLKIQVEEE